MTPLDNKTREQIVARVLAAREQRPQGLAQMRERQNQGLEVARKCAQILKEEFGATTRISHKLNSKPNLEHES